MASRMLGTMFQESMSSTALDRFGGSSAWEQFCEWEDARYAEMTLGKTCLDCGNCRKCEIEGHESIGYCMESGEFVDDSELVSEHGCQAFAL